MTDLSPREKALVEAARKCDAARMKCLPYEEVDLLMVEMTAALRAYDPPKPKIPVLPPWEELLTFDSVLIADFNDPPETISIGPCLVRKEHYEAIRTLTSKEQE